MSNLRIAIVHDAFVVKGGAERLAFYISKVFPDAPIFSSVYLQQLCFEELRSKEIHTLPFSNFVKNEKQFKFFYPLWLSLTLNKKFDNFDLVLSSSSYLAKFISAPRNGKHISYLHNPFRFIWKQKSYSYESLPYKPNLIRILKKFTPYLQKFDYKHTNRIDKIITNSNNIQSAIKKIYNRDSDIIYPPVEVKNYFQNDPQDFYLSVGRLISHKRHDLAINACNELNRKLVIIGEGPERKKLQYMAGSNVEFLGNVDDRTLKWYFSSCKALIFASNEDFGMVPIEVHASGRPVIALEAGGALETLQNGINGIFFKNQSIEDVIGAIIKFERLEFSTTEIINSAKRFDFSNFEYEYKKIIENFR